MNNLLIIIVVALLAGSARGQTQLLSLSGVKDRIDPLEYVTPPAAYGDAHVCLWEDDKTGVFTWTVDGVWSKDHDFWMAMADSFDCPVTFFAITHTVGTPGWSDWPAVRELYDAGHAIQSHSATHHKSLWEFTASKDSIESAMPGNTCYSLAYPSGADGIYVDTAVAAGYNGSRGTTGKPNDVSGISYKNSYSSSGFDRAGIASTLDADSLRSGKSYLYGWVCFHMHQIRTDDSTLNRDAHKERMRWVDAKGSTLWRARYPDVSRYGQERDTHTLELTSVAAGAVSFTLTDSMHDSVFTYPLTVKVRVDSSWDTVLADQNGTPVPARLVTDDAGTFVLVKAVPDQGTVTVSDGSTVRINTVPGLPGNMRYNGSNAILYDMNGNRRQNGTHPGMYLQFDPATGLLNKVMILD